MNMQDLKELLRYAEALNLMNKPFQEVYNMWQNDMRDTLDSWLADEYLASQEFYDQCYLDQAV